TRTADEWRAIQQNPSAPMGKSLVRHSYLRRGHYVWYLNDWMSQFGKEKVHIVNFDTFFEDPATSFTSVLDFIGLDRWLPYDFVNYSYHGARRPDAEVEPALRERLREHFQKSNEDLFALLDQRLGW